mgnify:FL=1
MKKEIVEAILTAINLTLIYLINDMASLAGLLVFALGELLMALTIYNKYR